jgi:hypothetical protein
MIIASSNTRFQHKTHIFFPKSIYDYTTTEITQSDCDNYIYIVIIDLHLPKWNTLITSYAIENPKIWLWHITQSAKKMALLLQW